MGADMKPLTQKLQDAAEYVDNGYGGLFAPMSLAGVTYGQAQRVKKAFGMDLNGNVEIAKVCGVPTTIHVPQEASTEEKVLLLLFAARLNETGDL